MFGELEEDVSTGGIGVTVDGGIARGDTLLFGLDMPDGKERTLHAEVRYVFPNDRGDHRAGLCWVSLQADERDVLQGIVNSIVEVRGGFQPYKDKLAG